MLRTFYVAAAWDAEASVWVSESNIPGLVVEADSLGEFEELVFALAPELLAENVNIHNERVQIDLKITGSRELAVA
jgi:Domain of unknown function (DUF1902)